MTDNKARVAIELIDFDQELTPAMQYAFGNTVS